jgi:putative Holliday junction resolvase
LKVLGIDYGQKRIGLAATDEAGMMAHGMETLVRSGDDTDFERLADIVRSEGVGRVVVGMPFNMDGSIGFKAKEVEEFVERLGAVVDVPIDTWDERLSTARAEREMLAADMTRKKRSKRRDRLAAQFILQGYLDSHPELTEDTGD